MPNIANVLRQEITRLARKEVKTGIGAIRRATTQYRSDIAELKRQVAALSKQVVYLERQERKRFEAAPSPTGDGRRFSSRGLKSHRLKLGFSAADYADLIGVSAQTIYSWEQGKSKPRQKQRAAVVAVRDLGKRDAEKQLEMLDH